AASVLPDPVGATTSACSLAAAACHAPTWASVGAANAPSNHCRVAGVKSSRTLDTPSILTHPTDSPGLWHHLARSSLMGERPRERSLRSEPWALPRRRGTRR